MVRSVGLLAILWLAAFARASEETLETFWACHAHVRRRFYDVRLHGVDWEAIGRQYRSRADRAAPGPELHAVLSDMLAELKASHAAILEAEVYHALMAELRNERFWTFGLVLEESRPGELFLRAAFEGSDHGLLVGDRIRTIDGKPALASKRLVNAGYDPTPGAGRLYFLRAKKDDVRVIRFQRRDGGPIRATKLTARRTNGVDACRASVRVVKWGPCRIGTLHIWYCQPGVARILRRQLREGRLKDCDALVLDLRGRGGWGHVADAIVRILAEWKRPLVVLADHRTRSAKEVLAQRVRTKELGLLVGTRTEGAVLGAGFFALPDGAFVELPIADVVVDGIRLEGRGVAPHLHVPFAVPYAAGKDAIFQAGCDAAVRMVARLRGWRIIRGRSKPGRSFTAPLSVPIRDA